MRWGGVEVSSSRGSELDRYWRIVLGAFIGIGGGFASLYFYTAGVFIKPMAAEFGWTRGEASLGSLATLVGVVAFPLAGRAIDRFGEIRVALASGLALAISFIMLGLLTAGLASFLILVALLTFVGAGSLSIGYNRIIVRHFSAQRGLALGLALTGTAVGSAFVAPVLTTYVAANGWRQGYYVLAAATVVMTAIALLLLRRYGDAGRTDARPGQSDETWLDVCRHPAFASTSLMIFLSATAVLGTTTHIIPLLSDTGLGLGKAAAIASALGFSVIAGRLATGYLLDRWDAGWITCLLFILASLGALALWSSRVELLLPGVMLIGFGVGTEGDLLAYLLGRRFPSRTFGSVYGAIFGVHAVGGALGGIIAGASVDATGDYAAWLLLASACLLTAGIIAFLTERHVVHHAEA